MARTAASPRVERAAARAGWRPGPSGWRWRSAPRPVRRAGSRPTQRAATSTMTSRTTAWVSAASRDVAPERTLTAVRAIAAVAGMPPNSGAPRLARPWPTSSRFGVVPLAHAHRVGDRGRQQALQRGQCRDRDGGQQQRVEVAPAGRRGGGGAGSPVGMSPIGAAPRPRAEFVDGGGDHREQRAWPARSEPGQREDHRRRRERRCQGGTQTGLRRPGTDGASGQDEHLLGVRRHAERGGQLLQADDRRDADGEPLHDRDRDVADEPAGAGVAEPDQDEPGQQTDRPVPRRRRGWRRSVPGPRSSRRWVR